MMKTIPAATPITAPGSTHLSFALRLPNRVMFTVPLPSTNFDFIDTDCTEVRHLTPGIVSG
jgi:hypothetical protein